MGRILGPADYGVLAVLMSIIFLHGIPNESIQNLISRYTSKFNAKKENGKIKYLMLKAGKKGFVAAIVIFIILVLVSFLLANFLISPFFAVFI